jgi:hypothetical protein
MSDQHLGSHSERVKLLRNQIEAACKARSWSRSKFAEEAKLTRATIRRVLNQKGDSTPRDHTLESLEKFVASIERPRGFASSDLYRAIAEGMNASLMNKDFIELYTGEYRMVRAHVPSGLALVSKLRIFGDKGDNMVIRYTRQHVVSDALSLFDDEDDTEQTTQVDTSKPRMSKSKRNAATKRQASDGEEEGIKYEGFVFNSQRRAFLLATSPTTAHVKEMVLSMPAAAPLASASIRGLVLTVSADERDPFAARIMVVKWPPPNLTSRQESQWEPGLKHWEDMPKSLQREFTPENKRGILQLHG